MKLIAGALLAGLVTVVSAGRGGAEPAADTTSVTAETASAASSVQATEASPGTDASTVPPPAATTVETLPEWSPPQESLDAAVLTIADMPTGWATLTDDDDNDAPCDAGLAQVLGFDGDLPQGEFIAAADPESGPLLGNFVTVLPPDAPDDAIAQWRDRMLACHEESDGVDVSYSELSFPAVSAGTNPPMGDEAFALRLTLASDTVTNHIDMLIIRAGDVVVALQAYDRLGDATALLAEYAPTALDRATSALG